MNWTILAAAGKPAAMAVDPKGVLIPGGGGWSLDWWVRAEDRWHYASEEVAVRQRLAPDGVAIETLLHVPGGDIVHTAYVCVGPGGPVGVVEVRNDSAVPVAVAFAVRPNDLRGRGAPHFSLDGAQLRSDGRAAVTLPGAPSDTLTDRLDAGDLACVFPLPHTSTVRAALRLQDADTDLDPAALPSAAAVARGWISHFQQATRLEVPDPKLQRLFEVARRRVIGASPGQVVSFPALDRRVTELDVALVANALEGLGHAADAKAVLDSVGWRELPDVAATVGDLQELLAEGSPTGAVPGLEGGGTGDDLAAAARVLLGTRRLLLDDMGSGELAFMTELPRGWEGQAAEIHAAPTSAGSASVALRWHGARPALLWSVDTTEPFRLIAPRLDPDWSTTEPVGEALLGEFEVAER